MYETASLKRSEVQLIPLESVTDWSEMLATLFVVTPGAPLYEPPWWVTLVTGLVGAVIGILLTAIVANSREQGRWLWQKKADLYARVLEATSQTADDLRQLKHKLGDREGRRELLSKLRESAPPSDIRTQLTLFGSTSPQRRYEGFIAYRRDILAKLEADDEGVGMMATGSAKAYTMQEIIRLIEIESEELGALIIDEVYESPRLFSRKRVFRPTYKGGGNAHPTF